MTPVDDIFAELTPPGRGGISTLALLGPGAAGALRQIFRSGQPSLPGPGQLAYGRIVGDDGEVLDEVIVRGAPADAGPVTELEVHCHGGPAAVQALAGLLAAGGLVRLDWPRYLAERAARRGESQIGLEAELLLPGLATLPAAMVVVRQRGGVLAEAIRRIAERIASGDAAGAVGGIGELLAAYEHIGRHIERPPRIAILGPPNAGKSSLLNRLVGHERAIVSEVPGTTRDVVTEMTALAGLPVVLADTAGLREPGDLVEQLGVERARAEADRADVLLCLVDLTRAPPGDYELWLTTRPARNLRVGTKADLAVAGDYPIALDVATSAITGQGIDELVRRILDVLGFRWPAADEAAPFTARQAAALRATRDLLAAGRAAEARAALAGITAPVSRT
jgi:tRNA modification GTPase